MNATDIHKTIQEIDKQLFALSDNIARKIEFDGIDPVYLHSKFTQLLNTAKHIEGQLKHIKKTTK